MGDDLLPMYEGTARNSNMVAVPDPNNPGRMIWVAAGPDSQGNLVPTDSRYQILTTPSYGNQQSSGNEIFMIAGAVLVVFLLVSQR